MEANGLWRHQIIKARMAPHTEKVADAAILLWEQMATKIILIVGEGGFNAIYARSVYLAQPTFPWLAASARPPADHRFVELKINFADQTPAEVSAANCLLLITFTNILASLIGENLTASILRSAWGSDASHGVGKGVQK